jgi:hypothetical protein
MGNLIGCVHVSETAIALSVGFRSIDCHGPKEYVKLRALPVVIFRQRQVVGFAMFSYNDALWRISG